MTRAKTAGVDAIDVPEATKAAGKATAGAGAAGFGAWAGHAFPDKDITLFGIGHHRNFAFHSGAVAGLASWGYRKYHNRFKDSDNVLARLGDKAIGAATIGLCVGLGVHLVIDVFQGKAVLFPFIGSLVNGTLVDDRLWLAANAGWCFYEAWRTAKIVFPGFIASVESAARTVAATVKRTLKTAWSRVCGWFNRLLPRPATA